MIRIVLGLALTLISVIGIVRGFIWIFQLQLGWALMNFLVYGLTLWAAHALLKSRRTIITRWVNERERSRA